MRRRSISQRREPASHWPPAWRMSASNCRGQRTAIWRPSMPNSHGPMWSGSRSRSAGSHQFDHPRGPSALSFGTTRASTRCGARNSCTEIVAEPAARRRCPHRRGLAGPRCAIVGTSDTLSADGRGAPTSSSSWRWEGRSRRCRRMLSTNRSTCAFPASEAVCLRSEPRAAQRCAANCRCSTTAPIGTID